MTLVKSNQTVSTIDQKLAAEFHLRQIEAIVRLESLAEKADASFFTAGEKLIQVAAAGQSNPRVARLLFIRALKDVQQLLLDGFEDFAFWSFDALVVAYAKTIPPKYFRVTEPRNYFGYVVEDERGIQDDLPSKTINVGKAVADLFTEPIVDGNKKISFEEWVKILKFLVFEPPPLEEIQAIVRTPDETGLDWQDRILRLSNKITDVERVANQLSTGYSSGENVAELSNRLRPLVNDIRSSAKRIARTEGLRVAERIQRRSWTDLGEMMIGVQILAVLDENTRPHHALRNGDIYATQPTPGQKHIDELPLLPDEPNCRCWSTPVLKSPAEFESDPILKAEFQNAQGAGIPDPSTYDTWFNSVDPTRRKMAVGSRRYAAMKGILDREPEWTDFIGIDGKLMKISDLKAESNSMRAERKQAIRELIDERRNRIRQVSSGGFIL